MGLFFLIRGVETGPYLKVYILDVSKAELEQDVATAANLRSTALYKLLVEQTVGLHGGEPWAVAGLNYRFEPAAADVDLLGRMTLLADAAGAALITAAHDSYLGIDSLARSSDPHFWSASEALEILREMPEARRLGLALPRFLLRLPYGEGAASVESFDFQEVPAGAHHDDFLWGNPVWACLMLVGKTFSEAGWSMQLGTHLEISGLPVHTYRDAENEPAMTPCAEIWLTQKAVEVLVERGFIPLIAKRGADSVRVAMFQSLKGGPLEGRWAN
jgi:type VI secretion system protein ImpC